MVLAACHAPDAQAVELLQCFKPLMFNQTFHKVNIKMVSNIVHSLTDAFALATSAIGHDNPNMANCASEDGALYNIFVTENGVRSLVRDNVPSYLASALVSSANHGANLFRSGRFYEVEQIKLSV